MTRVILALSLALLCAGCVSRPVGPAAPASGAPDPPAGKQTPSIGDFVGTWDGEYRGTQAFARLRVASDGSFTASVDVGPDRTCEVSGKLTGSGEIVDFHVNNRSCEGSESAFGRQRVLNVAPDAFTIAEEAHADAVQRGDDGSLAGPVWEFRRKRSSAQPR